MGDGADWWLGRDGRWREGLPPPDWRRGHDRRWYPAELMPPPPASHGSSPPAPPATDEIDDIDDVDRTHLGDTRFWQIGFGGDLQDLPSDLDDLDDAGPRHLRAGWTAMFDTWPSWARVGVPAVAVLIVLAGLVLGTQMFGDADQTAVAAGATTSTTRPHPATTSTTTSTTATTSTTTTTTTAPSTTTSNAATAPPTTPPATTAPPTTRPPTTAAPTTTTAPEVRFRNCREARQAGAAPIHPGEPGYDPDLDHDGNGIACDERRGGGRGGRRGGN